MIKDVDQMIKEEYFDGIEQIGMLNILSRFQDTCDTNNIHEGAAKWLINFVSREIR